MQTAPAPYQYTHHTADGLAVYVDEPEVMHRIPGAPESETIRTLPDCLAIPTAPDAAFLSMVLRDQTIRPAGFVWDFSECATCAVGMARQIWTTLQAPCLKSLYGSFGLDWEGGLSVFGYELPTRLGVGNCDITPNDVADALGAAIASQVSA